MSKIKGNNTVLEKKSNMFRDSDIANFHLSHTALRDVTEFGKQIHLYTEPGA